MSEKTEQPTAKKLRDARQRGEVAKSRDFTQTALIVALFAYV
ncbi:MAG: EscU/YscU/HrcU family type III secretion system export apparatus switch protein, partial [Betaproteobacteria bacterium]|nr:EscU/YscU/HrcU family type III secretion system export apparatus switch protein [Betaproteobacteria bacterium]